MSRRGGGPTGLGFAGPGGTMASPARLVILAGLIAAVVVVLGYFVFRQCTGASCTKLYCASSGDAAIPEGYERVTSVYKLKSGAKLPDGNDVQVFLPLSAATDDGRNLSFYRYIEQTGAWEPVAPAILDAQGNTVAATLPELPDRIAVLRRLSGAGHVVGYVKHNQALHPSAAANLTVLHTRDFRPGSDGRLEGTITDPKLIGAGPEVQHFPTVYVDGADKGLIPIVDSLMTNTQARTNHVRAITALVNERQLPGIDISYFDLNANLRTPFALFILELGQSLQASGKRLSVTLPAPQKAGDRIDEGSYDWKTIGQAADILQIWPYRDQSTLRRDLPEILTHLKMLVEPAKLVYTVTPYATEKSVDGIRTMSLLDAMTIAGTLQLRTGADGRVATNSSIVVIAPNINQADGRSGIGWQASTASVAFTYEQNVPRTVWIENFFSIGFKLQFIVNHKLGGVAIEDASSTPEIGNIWPALIPFISTGQPVLLQPNPAELVPEWTVSKGTGDGGQKGELKWATPAESGTYTIKLTISDGIAAFENTIPVTVQQAARPTPTVAPSATPRN
ncbi:MAG: glycosyl hydrolase family 18 protein [Dehalococcoidia bacterium]